ncbi:MAG TPA: sulfotransferase [Steroidobacteraceae bacterium]|nr:sulfotransferase [Steroidobacteraceae bacterium]
MMNAHFDSAAPGAHVAFLVGAGRSGTTLLHKLLCLHQQIAYISNYENRFPWFPDGLAARVIAGRLEDKLNAWFDKRGNAYFINRPWLKKIFPTPHEGESVFASCGIPLFPAPDYRPDASTAACLRRRFGQIRNRAGAAIFLSKRTANNRRIGQLLSIFPAARFVHLVRDGREVTQSLSTVEWWDNHQVWWDGRTPLQMERSGEPRLAVCARNWVREMQELHEQLAHVDPSRLFVLRFEELLRDPLRHLERVMQFLGVDFTVPYRAAIESLNLRPVGAKWTSEWNADQLACVLKEAQSMLGQLGYAT